MSLHQLKNSNFDVNTADDEIINKLRSIIIVTDLRGKDKDIIEFVTYFLYKIAYLEEKLENLESGNKFGDED